MTCIIFLYALEYPKESLHNPRLAVLNHRVRTMECHESVNLKKRKIYSYV